MTKKLFFLFIAAQLSVGLCAQSVTVYNPAIQNKVPERQAGAVSEVETDTVPADERPVSVCYRRDESRIVEPRSG